MNSDDSLQANSQKDLESDAVNLVELFNILAAEKWLIFGVTSFIAVMAVVYSLLLSDVYRAEATLVPVTEEGLPQLTGQIGLLNSFPGFNPQLSSTETQVAISTLLSRDFITKFIREHQLLPWLFASQFDPVVGESVLDEARFEPISNSWLDGSSPTEWDAFELFYGALYVNEDSTSGIVSIAFEWQDPFLASSWLNMLIEDVNNHLRNKDKEEATKSIEFLQSQLDSTQLLEMQRMIYQITESQTRVLMLADAREGYAFEVIDPAVPPQNKFGPARLLILVIGAFIGSLLSVLIVLLRYSFRKVNLQLS